MFRLQEKKSEKSEENEESKADKGVSANFCAFDYLSVTSVRDDGGFCAETGSED